MRIAWGAEWYFRFTGKRRWLSARVHKPFLRWLSQHVLDWKANVKAGVQVRTLLLVILPRDVGKTVLGTKCASLWAHLDDPNMTSFIGSETHSKAKSFLSAVKAVMEGDDDYAWFSWLYGNWRHARRAWNDAEVRHAYRASGSVSEPSFGTFGLDMGITGSHPMWLGFDDPNSAETLSEGTLEDGRASYDSAAGFALHKAGFFLGSMTRYATNDVPGHIMATEGVASWSGIPNPDPLAPKPSPEGHVHVYFMQGRDASKKTAEYPKGTPVFPEVYSYEALEHLEKKNSVDFSNQIQNTPSIGEHMPLEYAQLQALVVSRDDVPAIDFATVHLDSAFKEEARILRGDWNVIAGALHAFNGRVFVDRIIRNKEDRVEQYITRLCGYLMSLRARHIRVKCITDELEGGGKAGAFKQLLIVSLAQQGFRIGPDSILTFNRTTRKELRLRKAASYWVEGHARIIKGIEWEERLKFELVNLTRGDHDDIIDALSDVWQPGVWAKPQSNVREDYEDPLQPGDEVLRPGVMTHLQLNGSARHQRVAEMLEQTSYGREWKDDNV